MESDTPTLDSLNKIDEILKEPEKTPEQLAKEKQTLHNIGEQLKKQHSMRMNQPAVQIKQRAPFPPSAQTEAIARQVCAEQGHTLIAFNGKVMRPTGQDQFKITEETMMFCTKCGGNLQEIKGQ